MGKPGGGVGSAPCVVHNKVRALDCLVETGAGLVCAAGNACRTGGSKDVVCKFWKEGKCAKGTACPYAHEDAGADTASWTSWEAPAKAKGHGKSPGPPVGSGGWSSEKGARPAKGGKEVGKGSSKDGGKKGGKDWGKAWGKALAAFAPPKGKGASKGGAHAGKNADGLERATCRAHGKVRILACLEDMGDGYICKPGSECQTTSDPNAKQTPCKFFLKGDCQRGEYCAYSHDVEGEEALPPMEDDEFALEGTEEAAEPPPVFFGKEKALCAAHNKLRDVEFLVEGDDSQLVCRPDSECRSLGGKGKGGKGKPRPPCKFFARGVCAKGEACPFVHSAEGEAEEYGAAALPIGGRSRYTPY